MEGIVLVRGKPKSGLLVRFMPDPNRGNDLPINSMGETDGQGKYELQYTHEGQQGLGAPIGWHRVLIEDTAMARVPQEKKPPPRLIPRVYNSPATTPLVKEIVSGSQTIDLEIGL